ncbi:MAG: serine/threonine-protein kinase [Myxococcales bacterium]
MAHGQLPSFRPARGALGPYRLVCELAAGGMGTVYVAQRTEETGIERTVALKTIRSHLTDRPDFVRMFVSEARVLSSINHPYVCKLWDVGTAGGSPFLAMEYLVGEPLSRLFPLMSANRSDFSTGCLVRTVAKLCEGLHAAHEVQDQEGVPLKIVHRDISPQNLFLLYDGTVRILDFGVARGGGGPLTPEGTIKGKCAYMSPEQVRAQEVDRRTDVWSLGVVTWEMLTGRALFSHESETKASVGVELGKIDPPSKHNDFVPPDLDEVVMRALRRHPDDRYADALAFGNALEQLMSSHFGHIPRAALGSWLDAMFPGSREYRKMIVQHSRRMSEPEVGRAGRTTRRTLVTKPIRKSGPKHVSNSSAPPAEDRKSVPPLGSAVSRAMQSIARWVRGNQAREQPQPKTASGTLPGE